MSVEGLGQPPWWDACIFGGPKGNKILPVMANVLIILEQDPLFAGKIGWDKLRDEPMLLEPMPWSINGRVCPRPFDDADDTFMSACFQMKPFDMNVSSKLCHEAVNAIATRNSYHPVINYFNRCAETWDGFYRIDTVPERIFHVKTHEIPDKNDEDLTEEERQKKAYNRYVRSVLGKWMISAVARICDPGCKVDHVLILEGEQELKKSQVFKILGTPWYTPDIAALGSKDAAEQIVGVWIVELDELDALTRARDVAATKSFITRETDRFRWSYGRRVGEYRRQCVFGGTVNPQPWMRDPTGGRRFWILACPKEIDTNQLIAERDQLWGEAFARYKEGEIWYLTDKEVIEAARAEQMARAPEDPWLGKIRDYLNTTTRKITTYEALEYLKIPSERQGKAEAMRVGVLLKSLGYEPKKVWDSDSKNTVRVYEKLQ